MTLREEVEKLRDECWEDGKEHAELAGVEQDDTSDALVSIARRLDAILDAHPAVPPPDWPSVPDWWWDDEEGLADDQSLADYVARPSLKADEEIALLREALDLKTEAFDLKDGAYRLLKEATETQAAAITELMALLQRWLKSDPSFLSASASEIAKAEERVPALAALVRDSREMMEKAQD